MKLISTYCAASDQPFDARFARRWMAVAVGFFGLASVLGTLMRYYYVAEVPGIPYRYLLHAHSHVALLGWSYLLVSGALLFLLISRPKRQKVYHYLWRANIVAVAGMAIFFLYQGYGAYSIAFSTLHLLSAYAFAYYFLRDLAREPIASHTRWVQWSIYWLLVSTVGLWAIAPISMTLGKLHPLYFASIQFFLHFQFNGWLTYAMLGLWIFHRERQGIPIRIPSAGFGLLQLSLLLTYALSVTWSTPLAVIFYLNTAGVVLQVAAFYLILRALLRVANPVRSLTHWTDGLLLFGILCLVAKVVVQLAVALPAVATISYTIRHYVIGFIHLITLGAITLTGGALLLKHHLLPTHALARSGWLLLLVAFVLTEIALFGQGTLLWMRKGFVTYYSEIMVITSALFPVAIAIIAMGFYQPAVADSS